MSRLSAFNENREYFFTVKTQEPARLVVEMYSTEYVLIKTEKGWENWPNNRNYLAPGLVDGVIAALQLS